MPLETNLLLFSEASCAILQIYAGGSLEAACTLVSTPLRRNDCWNLLALPALLDTKTFLYEDPLYFAALRSLQGCCVSDLTCQAGSWCPSQCTTGCRL